MFPDSVRIVVLDTNVLLEAVAHFARDGSSAVLGAAKAEGIRLFAPDHVLEEAREKVLQTPGLFGHEPSAAARALDEEFLPLIRFVDVSGIALADPRIGRISAVGAGLASSARTGAATIRPDLRRSG